MERTKAIEVAKILQTLIDIADVSIILNNFINAFQEKSITKEDGRDYLHGNFNMGGTVSGRLSSNSPNLQNLPSTGSPYAKRIKECFETAPGWLLVGADFNALEARIAALLTRDPVRMKVYTDGYDSHSVNAFGYWPDKFPGIIDTIESINTIPDKFPELRQKSKTITFAAQYGGTFKTFMNSGFSKEEAQALEANYHKLYSASDVWVKKRIQDASDIGYATVAFGLRVRTPLLAQVLIGRRGTPYEAQAEARTVGNATQQSYGLLNNRAAIEFQKRCLASVYKYDIKPIAHIHDSQYFLIKNNVGCIKWVNDNLIQCMQWTGLKELEHPIVKLGGTLEIYHPTWATKYSLPNKISKKEILAICASEA